MPLFGITVDEDYPVYSLEDNPFPERDIWEFPDDVVARIRAANAEYMACQELLNDWPKYHPKAVRR